MKGRIWFEGNPWPNGHAVEEFIWQILLQEDAPRLLLHLRSEEYMGDDSEDLIDEEVNDDAEGDDWSTPGVWGNYGQCVLSNIYWGVNGNIAPKINWPILKNPENIDLYVDPLNSEASLNDNYRENAFDIYLLGHDSVRGNKISIFTDRPGFYNVKWAGAIALSYSGEYDYRYRFFTVIEGVQFGGFRIENPKSDENRNGIVFPKWLPPTDAARELRARNLAARYIIASEGLEFRPGKGFQPDFLFP